MICATDSPSSSTILTARANSPSHLRPVVFVITEWYCGQQGQTGASGAAAAQHSVLGLLYLLAQQTWGVLRSFDQLQPVNWLMAVAFSDWVHGPPASRVFACWPPCLCTRSRP